MAKNQLSYALGLDTQGYQQGLQAAARSTQQFEGDLNDMSAKFFNVRKELRENKRELLTLEAAWRQMTRAERESSMGQNMYQHMQDLIVKGGQLQDVMEDTQETLRNYGSDTRNIDAAKQAFETLGNTVSAVAGAYATLTGDTEAAKRALTMYTTVQSVINAMASLSNILRSTSPLMLMIKRAQDALRASTIATTAVTRTQTTAKVTNTAATVAQTNATEGATIAQAAFNAVADANPYVLLASVAIAAAAAIGIYVAATSKAMTAEEKHQLELKKQREEFKKMQTSVNNSTAKVLSDYKALQIEYNNLKTTHEKNQFLDENKNKFKAMGLAIDNINELEDALINKTGAVVSAIKARAEAEAWGDIYREKLRKKMEKDLNPSRANNRYITRAKEGDSTASISDEEAKALGINKYMERSVATQYGSTTQYLHRQLNATEALLVNIYRAEKAKKAQAKEDEELNKIEDELTSALEKEAEEMKKLGNLTTNNNKGSSDKLKSMIDKLKDEKAKYEKAREDLFDREGNITDKDKFDYYTKQIQAIEKALKKADDILNGTVKSDLQILRDKLEELENLRLFAKTQEEVDNLTNQIEDTKKKIEKEEIRLHIKVDPVIAIKEEVQKKLEDIFTIKIEAKDGFSRKQIDQIADLYKNIPVNQSIQFDASVELDTNALNQAERELGEFSLKLYNTLDNQLQDVKSLLSLDDLDDSTWSMLIDIADELNIKLEEVAETIANLDETSRQRQEKAETITKRADAWGYYGEMIRGVSNSFDALGESNAVVMAQFAMNTAAMIADAVKTIAALQAEAISGGAASAAKLPFPANLAAIATVISTLGAIFASIPKFEHGGTVNVGKTIGTGIINSPYKTGDKNVIRVNGDEMILNKRQQAGMIGKTTISSSEQRTLFSMINSGRLQNYSNSNNSNIKTVTTKLINYNSMQKFANGGVVGNYNTSHYNSSLISNIHGQEVLLNKVQNNSFNNSIDTTKADAIDITLHGETKLRGSDLDIMWKNFNTKTNRSR